MDAYFDCFSGISGDMILGAFLDLGIPVSLLRKGIASLPLRNFDIEIEKTTIEGISATNCFVKYSKTSKTKTYLDIVHIIKESTLSPYTKETSIQIFQCIARAESKIHDCNINQVQFHEIGAIDSIIDIIGTVICIEYLNIKNIFSSELPVGSGFIKCSHGTLPIPAPATVEILKGIPVYGSHINGELVTPTGAGIIATLAKSFGKIPKITIRQVGYGCGKNKKDNHPNLIRIILGEITSQENYEENGTISIIQTNIDDMNPEIYSFLIKKLLDSGALDVCLIPITMKKSRPAIKLEVICPENLRTNIIKELFSQTTTLGIRYFSAERTTLKRSTTKIQTKFGLIQVKVSIQADGSKQYLPEYEICKEIAHKNDIPIKKVYDIIMRKSY